MFVFSNYGGGFMEINILGKAILGLYRYLEPMTLSIDKMIQTRAFDYNCAIGYNVEDLSKEMISLTHRKVAIINLKVLIDKAISRLSSQNKRIIILKYIDNMSNKDITELMNISLRTFFRRLQRAFDSFCQCLSFENSCNDDILQNYLTQKWFRNFLDFFDDKKEKTEGSLVICNHLFREVKQVY